VNVPTFRVRYEDLVIDPKTTLTDLFRFILGIESLEGTVAEHRIDQVLAKGKDATQFYKQKSVANA
jgi:hypothetical protein